MICAMIRHFWPCFKSQIVSLKSDSNHKSQKYDSDSSLLLAHFHSTELWKKVVGRPTCQICSMIDLEKQNVAYFWGNKILMAGLNFQQLNEREYWNSQLENLDTPKILKFPTFWRIFRLEIKMREKNLRLI